MASDQFIWDMYPFHSEVTFDNSFLVLIGCVWRPHFLRTQCFAFVPNWWVKSWRRLSQTRSWWGQNLQFINWASRPRPNRSCYVYRNLNSIGPFRALIDWVDEKSFDYYYLIICPALQKICTTFKFFIYFSAINELVLLIFTKINNGSKLKRLN